MGAAVRLWSTFSKILLGIPEQSHPLPTYQLNIHISSDALPLLFILTTSIVSDGSHSSTLVNFLKDFLGNSSTEPPPSNFLVPHWLLLISAYPSALLLKWSVFHWSIICSTCCKVRHRQWLFSVFGEGIVSVDQHRQDKHKHTHWIILTRTQGKAP